MYASGFDTGRACISKGKGGLRRECENTVLTKRLGYAARVTKEAIKEDFLLPGGEGSEEAGSE